MVNLSVSRLFKVGSIPEAITEGIVEKAQALRTAGKEVTPEAVFTLVKKDPKLLQNIAVSYSEYLAKEMASGASHNAARASFIREIVRDQKFAESVRANPDGLRALYKEASDVLNEAEKLAPGYAKAANKPTQVQEFAQRALTSGKASAEDFQTMFNQLNTNGKIFAGSANDLGRKEYTKVPKILEAIRDGERVTLTEIERLRSNITRGSANVASVTHPGPGTTAGGAMGWLGLNRLMSAPGAISSAVSNAWAWGGWRLATVSGLAALGIGSYVGYNEGDLRGLGPTTRSIATLIPSLFDKIMTTSLEDFSGEKKDNTMAAQMYGTLTSRDGVLSSRFVEFTKDLTKIDLNERLKGINAGDPEYLERMYEVANKLIPVTSTKDKGLNADALYAYRYAFAANLGLEGGDKAKTFVQIADQLKERIVQSYTVQFQTGNGINSNFIAATKNLTGITLPSDPKTGNVTGDISAETLVAIATELQNKSGRANPRLAEAYAVALQKVIDPQYKSPEKADSKSGDIYSQTIQMAYNRYVEALKNNRNGEADAFYKKVLRAGALPASPDETNMLLLRRLQDPSFIASQDGRTLVALFQATQILGKDDKIDQQTFIAKQNEIKARITERIQTGVALNSQEVGVATGDVLVQDQMRRDEASRKRAQSAPAADAAPERKDPAAVTGMFNRLSEGGPYQELRGKGQTLSDIYKRSANDSDAFERELKTAIPTIKPKTLEAVRRMAYE